MRGEKRQAKGAKRGPRIQANTRYTRKSGAKTIEHLKKKQYTMKLGVNSHLQNTQKRTSNSIRSADQPVKL